MLASLSFQFSSHQIRSQWIKRTRSWSVVKTLCSISLWCCQPVKYLSGISGRTRCSLHFPWFLLRGDGMTHLTGEMVRSRHPNIHILPPGKGEFRYRSRAWKSLPSQTPCSHLVWGLVTNPGKGKVFVTQSRPTLGNLMDCNPPGSSVHGILQTGILEWVALPFSKGSSWPREQTRVSCIAGRLVTNWATGETWLEAQPFPDEDPKIQLQQGLEG